MNINELIKGIIIGIAKIIPGLSGAVLMISFDLYDKALDSITHFFQNPKKNLLFLANLGIGILLGIIFFSKILSYFMTKYYLYTTTLFIGLIMGGLPLLKTKITKKTGNYILILLSFLLMIWLILTNPNHNYIPQNNFIDTIVYFISGFVEAIGTILPGISSTAMLMLLGVYEQYIQILGNALNINLLKETLSFAIPFSLGLGIGIILISLLVNYLLKKYSEQTFSIIFGISSASVLTLAFKLLPYINSPLNFITSLILLILGYYITYQLS